MFIKNRAKANITIHSKSNTINGITTFANTIITIGASNASAKIANPTTIKAINIFLIDLISFTTFLFIIFIVLSNNPTTKIMPHNANINTDATIAPIIAGKARGIINISLPIMLSIPSIIDLNRLNVSAVFFGTDTSVKLTINLIILITARIANLIIHPKATINTEYLIMPATPENIVDISDIIFLICAMRAVVFLLSNASNCLLDSDSINEVIIFITPFIAFNASNTRIRGKFITGVDCMTTLIVFMYSLRKLHISLKAFILFLTKPVLPFSVTLVICLAIVSIII